jgi:hypothetical protein
MGADPNGVGLMPRLKIRSWREDDGHTQVELFQMSVEFIQRAETLRTTDFLARVTNEPTVRSLTNDYVEDTPDYTLVKITFSTGLGRDASKIPKFIREAARIREDGNDDVGVLAPMPPPPPRKSAWERIRDGWLV